MANIENLVTPVPEGLCVELGNDKKIRLAEWQGEKRVDIRQWTPHHPTKKGISIPLHRYLILRDSINDINGAIECLQKGEDTFFKRHLGGNVYIHVKTPYTGVDIRQWYLPEDEKDIKPGKGIFLKINEWKELCNVNECIEDFCPELKQTVRCYDQNDHMNQLGWIMCKECNPNGYYMDY